MERETGIEPATNSLEEQHAAGEAVLPSNRDHDFGRSAGALAWASWRIAIT